MPPGLTAEPTAQLRAGLAGRIDGGHLCRSQFLSLLLGNRPALSVVHFFLGLARLVECHASTGGNQPSDDDVLLQTAQLVALAHDRRLG